MKLKKLLCAVGCASLLAFSLASFTACDNAMSDEEIIRNAITEELDSIKNLDDDVLDELISTVDSESLSAYGIDGEEFVRSYLDGFDYTIDDISVDGDAAQVTVTLQCKSMSVYQRELTDIMAGVVDDDIIWTMDSDELSAYLGTLTMETLDNVDLTDTDPVVIDYTLIDNVWMPSEESSDGVLEALLSN